MATRMDLSPFLPILIRHHGPRALDTFILSSPTFHRSHCLKSQSGVDRVKMWPPLLFPTYNLTPSLGTNEVRFSAVS